MNPAARSSSPSNSFYALSDDEEGEYNTITSTTTGKGVKLLFSKSKASLTIMAVFERRFNAGCSIAC
jgi:hypothetical protein